MKRSAVLVFVSLAAFLFLLPLALKKPGLPMQLYGEEPTQYLMASSLARDGDLRCERGDVARLFAEFPFASGVRLSLASKDGSDTVSFAHPLPYPLVGAPFVALWGADGLIALNVLLFLTAIACAWSRLRRPNGDGVALLYAFGFFLFSTAFPYLFRMQPQVFVMALVALGMTLSWTEGLERSDPPIARRWQGLGGAALALAACQEPATGLLALPLVVALWRYHARDARNWLGGFVATVALIALLSFAWTGRALPSDRAAHGFDVSEFTLDSPLEIPWSTQDEPDAPETSELPGGYRSWSNTLEDASLLLWGRRAGLLPYFPMLVPLIFLVITSGKLSPLRWGLLATLATLGATQVILEPTALGIHQYQLANPHAVGLYPAFLFLIGRIRRPAITVGYALGALMLSTLVLTPFGGAVPGAPIHAHTRNFPFPWLPLEYPALPRAPGFRQMELHGFTTADSNVRLWAPADQTKLLGQDLWLLGGESVELWLESRQQLPSVMLSLRNLAPSNRITLSHAGQTQEREFDNLPPGGATFRFHLEPEAPTKIRHDERGPIYFYRLKAASRLGEKPKWRMEAATKEYLGVALAVLGTREFLDQDIFQVEWSACDAPPEVAPGEEFHAVVKLRNRSPHRWPHQGAARVRLSYHWRGPDGERIGFGGLRSELPTGVEPDQEITSWLAVKAPDQPGRYQLEVDPLFENVAWFSKRNGESTCRTDVVVAAAAPPKVLDAP